ncbi:MAG TPA: malate dehydrogenase, partial [Candidatus Sulfotelmatobacter sp.]|nr:malate dehydrogenase [Candidatus Sulfotelmatobacter sp.]
MSRDDLVLTNARIVAEVSESVAAHCADCVLIVVSNPLDAMAQLALAVTGFPRERVLGMAGILDSARFRAFLAAELHASARDIYAPVLGGHGDTMVPLTRLATVAGVPLTELVHSERLEELVERVRNGGAEIVSLLKTGSAFYAPSAAVAQMVDAILGDGRDVLPCSVLLEGEYGIDGVFTGVPCRLGAAGLVEIIEVSLLDHEREALHRSAATVRSLVTLIEQHSDELIPALPETRRPLLQVY